MKKIAKILFAFALAFLIIPAILPNVFAKQTIKAEVEAETPDGSIARPYEIASYEDLAKLSSAPANDNPIYFSLTKSWVYHEKSNKNNIQISNHTSSKKIIWLDLNGETITREGVSTDTSTFYISGNVEVNIYDSSNSTGAIRMWLDEDSNDSNIFQVNTGATLNIMSGTYEYYFEYNNSMYGRGNQISHYGDIFGISGGKVNIYDGTFKAANRVLFCKSSSDATIYNGTFVNERNYAVDGNRVLIYIPNGSGYVADMLAEGTTISPSYSITSNSQLCGAKYTFTANNSVKICSNIPDGSSSITIDQGEGYIFHVWVTNATFKWMINDTVITENSHPAIELIGNNNILKIKPSLANGLLDNCQISLSYKYLVNGVETTRDNEKIDIHVNRTHYVVYFDSQGHGDSLCEFIPMSEKKSVTEVINSITFPENDYDYFFMGYASDKLSNYSNYNEFIKAANQLKEDTTIIDKDYILYAGWKSYADDFDITFNQPTVKQLAATTELQSIGKVSFSDLIELSSYYTLYSYLKLKITAADLHAQYDETDKLDYTLYYKIGEEDSKAYSTTEYFVLHNLGNGVTEEAELFIKINDLSTRDITTNYVSELSYKAYIYDSLGEVFSSYTTGAKTNMYMLNTTLDSISLSGTHKKAFRVDDEFTYEGLVVTANYSDGSNREVTGYSVSTPDMTTIGEKTVTVSFKDGSITKENTYQISVVSAETPILDSITLSGTYKKEFKIGDSFTYEGLVVTAHYDGKADAKVTTFTVSTPDMTTAGEKTVTITYVEDEITKTAEYKINVKADTPIETEPVETTTSIDPAPAKKGGLNGGVVAGIVIGSVAVIACICVGGFFIIKKKRAK